jgi:hypothetical protein
MDVRLLQGKLVKNPEFSPSRSPEEVESLLADLLTALQEESQKEEE